MSNEEMVGKKVGKWRIIGTESGKKGLDLICQCECGTIKVQKADNIKNRRSLMCKECSIRKRKNNKNQFKKKTMSKTKIYQKWAKMKQRCYNPKDTSYKNYGGRGITVCEEWKNSSKAFIEWAYKNGYNEKHEKYEYTIDRIDVNGNYEPANCRFVTSLEQCRNKRNNVRKEYNGKSQTLAEWDYEYKVSMGTFSRKLKDGMKMEEIIKEIIEKQKNGKLKIKKMLY